MAKTVEVSDDDVKQVFDQTRRRYITPERRRVEQMVFHTMAEADAASARIKGGESFSAVAAALGLKEQDLDLGTVTKSSSTRRRAIQARRCGSAAFWTIS